VHSVHSVGGVEEPAHALVGVDFGAISLLHEAGGMEGPGLRPCALMSAEAGLRETYSASGMGGNGSGDTAIVSESLAERGEVAEVVPRQVPCAQAEVREGQRPAKTDGDRGDVLVELEDGPAEPAQDVEDDFVL
jgi:hypothetical protein